jgi:hypothetical protein
MIDADARAWGESNGTPPPPPPQPARLPALDTGNAGTGYGARG